MKHSSDSSSVAPSQHSKTTAEVKVRSSATLHKIHNESAQAAIIFLFIVGLVAILSLFIFMSPVMDTFSSFHHNATQGAGAFLPVSQERQDSVYLLQVAYQVSPFIIFILLIIAALVAALRWRTGNA